MSETENIEQLWYTWSTTGLDAIPAGVRVRAASPGLTELNSERMRVLDRYLRYTLPIGTNRLEVDPQQAPVCLAFLRGEKDERVLVHKVYTGRDGRNRPGNYFAHLLAGLPSTFSAKDAIALWRSSSWQENDVPAQGPNGQGKYLQRISSADFIVNHDPWSRVDKEKMDGYLPQFIQSYLLQRNSVDQTQSREDLQREIAELQLQVQKLAKDRQRQVIVDRQRELIEKEYLLQSLPPRALQHIYLAASADEAAYLLYNLFAILPPQWLEELTFSTYEQDVQVKHECLLINTCIPPTQQKGSRMPDVLPPVSYEGLALNCYLDRMPSLYDIPADNPQASKYASYATDVLITKNTDKLDNFLAEVNQIPVLTVDTFLRRFSFLEKETYTREEIVRIFWNPREFIPVSKEDNFRTAVHWEVNLDLKWFRDELKPPADILYKDSKRDPQLAYALKNFSVSTKLACIRVFRNHEEGAVSALFELLETLCPVPESADFWIELLRSFTSDASCKSFIQSNWNMRINLLMIAVQVLQYGKDEHFPIIDVLLSCTELEFHRLLRLQLPPLWKVHATKLFVERTSQWQPETVQAFEQAPENVSSLMTQLVSSSQPGEANRQVALKLFTKLANSGYKHLDELQDIWWKQGATGDELKELVHRGRLGSLKSGELLQNHGAQYMRTNETAQIIYPLFQSVATNVRTSDKKIPVLFSLLDQKVDIHILVELLAHANLRSGEIENFLVRYGPGNNKRYPQYPVLYPSATCWGNMLAKLAESGQSSTLRWPLLACCLDAFKKNYTAQHDDISIELLLDKAKLSASEAAKFFKEYGQDFVPFSYHAPIARDLYQSFVQSNNSHGKLHVLWSWFAKSEKMGREDVEWLLLNSALAANEIADFLETYGTTYIVAYPDSQVIAGGIESYLDEFNLLSYRSNDHKKRGFLEFLTRQQSLSLAIQAHAQILSKIVILAQQQLPLSQKDITELAGYLYSIPAKREQLCSPVAQVLALRIQDTVQLGNVIATMQGVFRDDPAYIDKMLFKIIEYVKAEIEKLSVLNNIEAFVLPITIYLQFLLGDSAAAVISEIHRRQALDSLLSKSRVQVIQAINGAAETWPHKIREKWYAELKSRNLMPVVDPAIPQIGEMDHLQRLPSPEHVALVRVLPSPSTPPAKQTKALFRQVPRTLATMLREVPFVLYLVWWQLPRACREKGTGPLTMIYLRYLALLQRYERLVPEKQWEKLRFAVTFHEHCMLADAAMPEVLIEAEVKILQFVDNSENRAYESSLTWHEQARIEKARQRLQEIETQKGKPGGNPVEHSPILPAIRLPMIKQ